MSKTTTDTYPTWHASYTIDADDLADVPQEQHRDMADLIELLTNEQIEKVWPGIQIEVARMLDCSGATPPPEIWDENSGTQKTDSDMLHQLVGAAWMLAIETGVTS